MTGERLQLLAWKRLRKASLVGFATVRFPFGLVVRDCPCHQSHGKTWASFPAKPQLDRDGQPIRDECGRITYSTVMEWESRRLREAFSERVCELVRQHDAEAFADDDTTNTDQPRGGFV